MNMSSAQFKALKKKPALTIIDSKKIPKKRLSVHVYASNLERDYAEYLTALKLAGKISDWRYEPLSFRLADKDKGQVWYKPDFLVEYPDGKFTLDEVKGYMRVADRIRLLVAASRFPWFRFRLVTREKKDWVIKEVGEIARNWQMDLSLEANGQFSTPAVPVNWLLEWIDANNNGTLEGCFEFDTVNIHELKAAIQEKLLSE